MFRTVAILATMVFARIDSCGGTDPRTPEPPTAPARTADQPTGQEADGSVRPVPPRIRLFGPGDDPWTDGLRDPGTEPLPPDLPANPEPATIFLAAAGLAAAAWWRHRRHRK